MSKTIRKVPHEHRNQVVQEMIIERVGVVSASKPMRAKQDRRLKDRKNHWSKEWD